MTQMSVFQLWVWIIHIVFSHKHAKWYNIPIHIIAVACTLLYNSIRGKFVHYVNVIVYAKYSSRHGFDCYGVYYVGDENRVLLFEKNSSRNIITS